jgi:hypothetical protein
MSNLQKIINILVIIVLLVVAFILFNNKKAEAPTIEEESFQGTPSVTQCFDVYCGIEQYLEENLAWTTVAGGVDFCSFNWLNEDDFAYGNPIFLDTLCQEYYVDDNGYLKQASGVRVPVQIDVDDQGYFSGLWEPLTADDNPELIQRFGEYYQDQDLIEFEKNNLINARRYFNTDIKYETAETLETSCFNDFDCDLPFDYAIRSNCRYIATCINERCAVVCPELY